MKCFRCLFVDSLNVGVVLHPLTECIFSKTAPIYASPACWLEYLVTMPVMQKDGHCKTPVSDQVPTWCMRSSYGALVGMT